MGKRLECAKAPCKSCPYRKDVPSGVWAAHEYDKLPAYDGEIFEQVLKGAVGVFMCHQNDGKLCAGWVGAHGASNLLAMRLASFADNPPIAPEVWEYKSPVSLFESGQAARAHGRRHIRRPKADAKRAIARLVRQRER